MSVPFMPSVKASLDSMLISEPNASQNPKELEFEALLMPNIRRLVLLFPFTSDMRRRNGHPTRDLDYPRFWTLLGESFCRLLWNYAMENNGSLPDYRRARLQGKYEAIEFDFGADEPILTAQRLQLIHSLAPLLPRIHSEVGLLGPFDTPIMWGRRVIFRLGGRAFTLPWRVNAGGTIWECDKEELGDFVENWRKANAYPNTRGRFPPITGDLNHVLEPLLQHLVEEKKWGLIGRL